MKKILLVDDDIHIQRLLRDELEEDGYQIMTASNGKEALSLINRQNPDLIILDLRMPELSGLDTMEFISKLKYKVPVIIFSAYGAYRNDPLAIAADAYVVKSSEISELKKKVHELV
jgi:DNA-binding response OmpR family regulator